MIGKVHFRVPAAFSSNADWQLEDGSCHCLKPVRTCIICKEQYLTYGREPSFKANS